MQVHVANVKAAIPKDVNASKTYRGVKASIGTDSYMFTHVKTYAAGKSDPTAYKGVKPTLGSDNYATSLMKEQKERSVTSERYSNKKLKPHVGADSKLMEYYRSEQGKKKAASSLARARSPDPHKTTSLGPDAFHIAHLRASRAQSPTARSYLGVKPSITADTFQANFHKTTERSWGAKKATKEVRL
jgi:hypothetical protein